MTEKRFRINTALAAIAVIALAVMAIGVHSIVPTASAATGTIDVLNVGTCLTTDDPDADDAIFEASDCNDGGGGDYDVAGRDDVLQVDDVYATYAHDPKTGAEAPRAILENSDLIKVSISDPGRDRRTGVLVRGAGWIEDPSDDPDAMDDGLDLAGADGSDLDTEPDTLRQVAYESLKDIEDLGTAADVAYYGTDEFYFRLIQSNRSDTKVNSVISQVGNVGFEFARTGTSPFPPMDVDGIIKVFGYETDRPVTVATPPADPTTSTPLLDLTASGDVRLDEDSSTGNRNGIEGGGDIAPWQVLQGGLSSGKVFAIVAVYYQTSDYEMLTGDLVYQTAGFGTEITTDDTFNNGVGDPIFTADEIEDNDKLVVKVEGDNDDGPVNLMLRETSRFSGRYEGYIRLTDADGRGPDDDRNWGRELGDATTADMNGPAVVGVQSGPVEITYKDSDGSTQPLRVQIDIQPPTITVDSPSSSSSTTDASPDFEGTFEDGDSGLMEDTFRLYVDNSKDEGDSDPVLDLPSGVRANNGVVQIRREFIGYGNSDNEPYGVLGEGDLFFGVTKAPSNGIAPALYVESRGIEDGDMSGLFDDGVSLTIPDLRGDSLPIDFQALVLDLAGNVGFSDADQAAPTFIDDLGTSADDDRDEIGTHNVIGWYSRHVLTYDDEDPGFDKDKSVTGFYGSDSKGKPIPDKRGILLVFNDDIDPASITTRTFDVELDDETDASIVDVDVHDKRVYLKLANELAPDETPSIAISNGEIVEDFAGNRTDHGDEDPFDAKDGIAPTLTVTLSGGSGTGDGNEGPSALTKNTIDIHIASDESIQGAPRLAVVCNNLAYTEMIDGENVARDVDDFVDSRSGTYGSDPGGGNQPTFKCGADDEAGLSLTTVSAYSRGGETWEYTWRNFTGGGALPEGGLTVVAWAQDRSSYEGVKGGTSKNFGAGSAGFTFDRDLLSPLTEAGGEVLPKDGDDNVTEARPFVLLRFDENTTVTLESMTIDDTDVTPDVEVLGDNRFIYWPLSLNLGEHTVDVEAVDAAGNERDFDYEFTVVTKGDFIIELLAGWNAISLPADPVDKTLAAVFTDSDIDSVLGWDASNPESPWRFASRQEGVWSTSGQFATLSDIEARYGYWVHSMGFIRQPVALESRTRGGQFPTPIEIGLVDGWSFVGVVDQDGDQTEDDFNTALLNSDRVPITAKSYLGDYSRAYTWDATFNTFNSLEANEPMMIGFGVWVYKGSALAP